MNESTVKRMAQAQRIIESGHPDIDQLNTAATISIVLKVCTQLALSYKAFSMVERYFINRK